MQIGLKISPRQIQTLKPTMQQLQYYRLLQQTNLELELDIREEVAQNPALEIEETRRCSVCGEILLDGQPCMTCIARKVEDSDRESIRSEKRRYLLVFPSLRQRERCPASLRLGVYVSPVGNQQFCQIRGSHPHGHGQRRPSLLAFTVRIRAGNQQTLDHQGMTLAHCRAQGCPAF